MALETLIQNEHITEDDVIAAFRIFCEVYELEGDLSDERQLRIQLPRKNSLMEGWRVDYRPAMGAKFFLEPRGKNTYFHGYNGSPDKSAEQKNDELQRRIFAYFGAK